MAKIVQTRIVRSAKSASWALALVSVAACSSTKFGGATSAAPNATSTESDSGSGTDLGADPSGGPRTVTVAVGQNANLGLPSADSGASCVSSDPTVATVDANTCVVTGVKPGTTEITATLANGTQVKVPVTVSGGTPIVAVKGIGTNAATLIATDQSQISTTPQFGLLVNNLECSFCHLKINGDVVSTTDVGSLWQSSSGDINGAWDIAGAYNIQQVQVLKNTDGSTSTVGGTSVEISVSSGVQPNDPSATAIPKNASGQPTFPTGNFTAMIPKVRGTLTGAYNGTPVTVQNVYAGNVVIVGTPSAPIDIDGEVLISGDLVIKGTYKGIGTIYVTGNIYVPGDILGVNSPFPYSTDPATALEQGKAALQAGDDALALATPNSIIISDFENHPDVQAPCPAGWTGATPCMTPNASVFEHPATPAADQASALGLVGTGPDDWKVFKWFPGGAAAFEATYDTFDLGPTVCPANRGNNSRSFSRIDSLLYAGKVIGGRANLNSYSINGGVIADYFHVISAAAACLPGIQPVHKQDQTFSYVNYDWRLKAGLLLLKQMASSF